MRPPRPVQQPRSPPPCARIPDANFREQKSCLQTVQELRGEPGRPGPRVLAPSPLPRARTQVETRRGAHPPAQPSLHPPRGSTDFSAGAGLALSPGCALTSLTPAPGATLSAPRNHPTQRETRQKKRKPVKYFLKIIIIIKTKTASPAHARRGVPPASGCGAQGRDHRSGPAPLPPPPPPPRSPGSLTVRGGVRRRRRRSPSRPGCPPRVRRAHALLPAPSALYRAAPREEEIDLSLPELFATRPFNRPGPGRPRPPRPPPPRAARPRLCVVGSGALAAASRGPGARRRRRRAGAGRRAAAAAAAGECAVRAAAGGRRVGGSRRAAGGARGRPAS